MASRNRMGLVKAGAAVLRGSGFACLGMAALAVGCSRDDGRIPTHPVAGKLTVEGEIPVGALVVLHPASGAKDASLRPSGKVGPDGKFRLTTYESDDGAPEGEYAATVQWNKLVKKGGDFTAGPNLAPPAYANEAASPWRVRVVAGSNRLETLDIRRK